MIIILVFVFENTLKILFNLLFIEIKQQTYYVFFCTLLI